MNNRNKSNEERNSEPALNHEHTLSESHRSNHGDGSSPAKAPVNERDPLPTEPPKKGR